MFYFTSDDYGVMKKNNWSEDYVIKTLEDYAIDYDLTITEVDQIFQMFGVNELFDGIPIACEDFSNMLGR